MSRCDLDLDRTMHNVELIRAIFIYYNMFKFHTDIQTDISNLDSIVEVDKPQQKQLLLL